MSSRARPALLALLLVLAAPRAGAFVGGIVGFSDIGCGDCHDADGVALAPQVEIVGPTAVEPGATVAYEVVITSQAAGQTGAGFNFAAEAGEVAVGDDAGVRRAENRELRRFELTHVGPRDNDGAGRAVFAVRWQAPAAPGAYVLFAAGNSVNQDNTQLGDASAFTLLTVTVGSPATPSPTPTATPPPAACAGDCNGDGGVAINELVTAVGIALGSQPLGQCAGVDQNGDATVAINELIAAVNRALGGC